eukprot:m.725036 g.725036  ORF g.725036 m.725036 type:complete len:55 (-) comp23025_c2_seq43:1666-1830(-)
MEILQHKYVSIFMQSCNHQHYGREDDIDRDNGSIGYHANHTPHTHTSKKTPFHK